ncbi:hypothetical protein LIER_15043 [Lithospermum erythrorhizon]|uniref:Transmembrane protein n=1 Tax=Lithospermum erythrorhizon TaxID=34254 RepID=A0AAV3Q3S4_LITER
MNRLVIGSCLQFPTWLIFSVLLQYIVPGLADGSSSSSSKNETKHSSRSSIITKALIGCLGVAIVAFSILLFKIWRRKKREEQQARLLKLFEDDDELEVELGIRD